MPYAILRFQKRKAGSVAACERHNERKKEAYKSNPDIDMECSKYNYHLVPPPRYTYKKEINRMVQEAGCKVRKDSVMMVETLITASPEFMNSLPPEEQKAYFAMALDFIAERVGKQNIISAVVHMDEKTPHMHLCFVPLTEDGRLSAKEIVGNKKKLTQWQDRFWEHMVKKYPDLERGESASETGRDHIPPRLFKEAVHLNRMKEQILKLMTDTNLLNKKSKMEELEALLDKYVPATEALRTKLRKYDKAYKALSDENSALEAELQTAKDASKEKIADRLKYGKTEQELCELHALIDNIPPEIVAAYRRKTTGLQNER